MSEINLFKSRHNKNEFLKLEVEYLGAVFSEFRLTVMFEDGVTIARKRFLVYANDEGTPTLETEWFYEGYLSGGRYDPRVYIYDKYYTGLNNNHYGYSVIQEVTDFCHFYQFDVPEELQYYFESYEENENEYYIDLESRSEEE
jgi:hypothetical protein